MYRSTLRLIDRTLDIQSHDGIHFSATEHIEAETPTTHGCITVDGKNFVIQPKGSGYQVLAETNTLSKASRIADAMNTVRGTSERVNADAEKVRVALDFVQSAQEVLSGNATDDDDLNEF